jgi:hypothetical protein
MLNETVSINILDISADVAKGQHITQYFPVAGLSEKYTLDGTLHDDVLTYKAEHTFKLNPVTPARAQLILAAYNKAAGVFLTCYDEQTGGNVTIFCKTSPARITSKFIRGGVTEYVQLSDLVFRQK